MDNNLAAIEIAGKLSRGEQFGIFGKNASVYFRDGRRYTYRSLWKGIRIANNLGDMAPCKTLAEECTNTYVGTFTYRHSSHKWSGTSQKSGLLLRMIRKINIL